MSTVYSLNDLRYLMSRLRDPVTGCPWDCRQNFSTIAPLTIEEAYEVVDAIERDDIEHLPEELGDLLFHIIFYAELGDEQQHFNFDDIVSKLVDKLVRRHPHVFPDGLNSQSDKLTDTDKVLANWEVTKQQERKHKGQAKLLDDIPIALPALTRALKIQKRAKSVGFDWSNSQQVLRCLRDELAELEEAMASQQQDAIADEIGDVFFTLVNLSRHLKLDPEALVRQANRKFTRRIEHVEQAIQGDWSSKSAGDLTFFWDKAKECENYS